MNTHPTLVHGSALEYVRRQAETGAIAPVPLYALSRVEVRVYDPDGDGYYFTGRGNATKWYRKEDPGSDHWTNCPQDAPAASPGQIQIVGPRGESFGLWPDWSAFAEDVGL